MQSIVVFIMIGLSSIYLLRHLSSVLKDKKACGGCATSKGCDTTQRQSEKPS